MAIGDLVSNMYQIATEFQPAAGVQICITQFLQGGGDVYIQGRGDIDTSSSNMFFTAGTTQNDDIGYWNGYVHKFFIDNDSYLNFNPVSGQCGFSGIQIQ